MIAGTPCPAEAAERRARRAARRTATRARPARTWRCRRRSLASACCSRHAICVYGSVCVGAAADRRGRRGCLVSATAAPRCRRAAAAASRADFGKRRLAPIGHALRRARARWRAWLRAEGDESEHGPWEWRTASWARSLEKSDREESRECGPEIVRVREVKTWRRTRSAPQPAASAPRAQTSLPTPRAPSRSTRAPATRAPRCSSTPSGAREDRHARLFQALGSTDFAQRVRRHRAGARGGLRGGGAVARPAARGAPQPAGGPR